MNQPLLSICIPTYNRASYLRECLDSIIPQIEKNSLDEKVEIVIADNASSDDTENIVATYISLFPGLTYFKNETNLGFDRSFVRLISKSTGRYCLCLGDDDALFEDSLVYLVDVLEKNQKVGLVWMNNWGYGNDLKSPIVAHPNLSLEGDTTYTTLAHYIQNYPQSFENLVGMFVGLSNQLFRRADWVNYEKKDQFLDTLAVHMYVSLTVFKEEAFIIVAKPIVKTRASNIRWNVFAGLETSRGRVKSTLAIATWIRNTYQLPVTVGKMHFNIARKEYWATFKESAKTILSRSGLGTSITWYRKIKALTSKRL